MRPSGRFAVGAIKGSTRNSNHLRSLFRRVASIDADADLCRQPPNTCSKRISGPTDTSGLLNFDESISVFQNTACAACHMPYAAFGGPIPSENLTTAAYVGSFRDRAAKRTPQRYTYSHTFPVLNFNTTQQLFFGGNFWDGRATGLKLQAPDAEQAQGPPVDPLEMGFADTACIAFRLLSAPYRQLFELVWASTSTSVSRPTLLRSAPSLMGQGGSAGARRQSR